MLAITISFALILLEILIFALLFFTIISGVNGAPFIPTTNKRLATVFDLIRLAPKTKIAELGAGNGKTVIALCQKGYLVDGFEINPFLVFLANRRIRKLRLDHQGHVYWKNLWNVDLRDYDAIYVYGIPKIIPRLHQKIMDELPMGGTIISIGFKFPNLTLVNQSGGVTIYRKP